MRTVLRRLGLLAFSALCMVAVACSGNRYEPIPTTGATLEGTVTYGKEKLQAALIIVAGQNGSAQGKIGADGRYKVDNVPLGEVTIAVNTNAARGEASAPTKGPKPKIIDVPPEYQHPIKSSIKTTIEKGSNTYDIKIPK